MKRAYLHDGATPSAATIKKYGSIYIPLLANISADQLASLQAAGVTVHNVSGTARRSMQRC
jgi:hypothetical protein